MPSTVVVSPKFQVVIPKEIRNQTDIRPGNKLHILLLDGQIRLVPLKTAKQLKGSLKGLPIKQSDIREKKDPIIWTQ
jgi:AbrB family looped-hinge helix DNA binding protein